MAETYCSDPVTCIQLCQLAGGVSLLRSRAFEPRGTTVMLLRSRTNLSTSVLLRIEQACGYDKSLNAPVSDRMDFQATSSFSPLELGGGKSSRCCGISGVHVDVETDPAYSSRHAGTRVPACTHHIKLRLATPCRLKLRAAWPIPPSVLMPDVMQTE